MTTYKEMDKAQLLSEKENLLKEYQGYCDKNLKLDMSRGKPAPEQLDLSQDMMNITDYKCENGQDARNYGMLEGIPEARRLFAELLGVKPEEVIVGGNASLQLMYFLIDVACRNGFKESKKPWGKVRGAKFLCPVPGYDRHFKITEHFGLDLIPVPMTKDGPDMDIVEKLAGNDSKVKGIWCVPKYSNPDGYTYSDETVKRLAYMHTAAADFKIFWDNAYCVHDLTDTPDKLLNIMDECKKATNENRVFEFCSTSKITFAGAGVSALAASESNIAYILKNLTPMTISYDKINQLRHVKYLKNAEGVAAKMQQHRKILQPKFETVLQILDSQLGVCGTDVHWTKPNGGYFISLYAEKGTAKRVVQLCKEAGVVLTGAGAAYPYGNDPDDSNIRIAPSYPSIEELELATKLLCVCVKLCAVEKALEA